MRVAVSVLYVTPSEGPNAKEASSHSGSSDLVSTVTPIVTLL